MKWIATLALVVVVGAAPLPDTDPEARVFDDFVRHLTDPLTNPLEVGIVGQETAWHCNVRALYFDLIVFANRYWPSVPAQQASSSATALSVLHRDLCEPTEAEPWGPRVPAPIDR